MEYDKEWSRFCERAIETIAVGVLIIGPDRVIDFANKGAEVITGVKRADIINRSYRDSRWRILTVDGQPVRQGDLPIERVFLTGCAVAGQRFALLRPDGSRAIVVMNASPLAVDRDGTLAVLVSIDDITDHNAAEEELEFKSTLLDSAIDGEIVHDLEGNILYVNEALLKSTGYTREELAKLTLYDVSSKTPKQIRQGIEKIERTGRAVFESGIRNKEGVVTPVEIHANLVTFRGRKAIATVARDITERKKREDDLKAKEERFRSLAESATDAIVGCRNAGTVVDFWNKAAERIFGYSADEIVNKPLALIIPERYREEHARGVKRLLESESAFYLGKVAEFDGLRKDGTEFPIEISLGSWETKEGVFFTAVIRDITDRKRAERALEEKDRAIRKAYVDVIFAVTGGKLVLMTPAEVDASLGEEIMAPRSITSYEGLAVARKAIQSAIHREFPIFDSARFIVAVGEALTNGVKHAGQALYQVFKKEDFVQVLVTDTGPGIDFTTLPKATLMAGYSTKATLGMGFAIMLDICDRVLLATQPTGTTVVLEVVV